MTFEDVRDLLASRGIEGADAATAFAAWQRNPLGADGCRVQSVLEWAGLAP